MLLNIYSCCYIHKLVPYGGLETLKGNINISFVVMESHGAQLNVLELTLSVGLEKRMGDLKPLYN